MKGLIYYGLGIITGAVGYYLYNKYYNQNIYNGALYNSYDQYNQQSNNQQNQGYTQYSEQNTAYAADYKESDTPSYVQSTPIAAPEPTSYSTGINPDNGSKYTDEQLLKAAVEEEASRLNWENIHANDYPDILTADEAGELPPHIVTKTLTFYHDDETLVDDETNQIVDRDITVGDCLEMWDDQYKGTFIDTRKPQLYVINYHDGILYDIHRVNGPFINV